MFEKSLTSWKSQYLSLGGIFVLINRLLDAVCICMMSLFPAPTSVQG